MNDPVLIYRPDHHRARLSPLDVIRPKPTSHGTPPWWSAFIFLYGAYAVFTAGDRTGTRVLGIVCMMVPAFLGWRARQAPLPPVTMGDLPALDQWGIVALWAHVDDLRPARQAVGELRGMLALAPFWEPYMTAEQRSQVYVEVASIADQSDRVARIVAEIGADENRPALRSRFDEIDRVRGSIDRRLDALVGLHASLLEAEQQMEDLAALERAERLDDDLRSLSAESSATSVTAAASTDALSGDARAVADGIRESIDESLARLGPDDSGPPTL